jgi:hypothetical protein
MNKPPLKLRNEVENSFEEGMSYWQNYTQGSKHKKLSNRIMILGGLLLGWSMYNDSESLVLAVLGLSVILIAMYFYVVAANKAKFAFKLYMLRHDWLNYKANLILDPNTRTLKERDQVNVFDVADDSNWQ